MNKKNAKTNSSIITHILIFAICFEFMPSSGEYK